MSIQIYLHLLFFCGILCQGIFATLSDKDTGLSSDFLVRKRRVVNRLPGGRVSIPIEAVNFLVKIKESARTICAGAILSHYTVITANSCLRQHYTRYQVYSGAAGNVGFNLHNITSKVLRSGNPPVHFENTIALITVDPLFQFSSKTGSIELLQIGHLPEGTLVSVFGWGCYYPLRAGTEVRMRLRRITLPIMNREECQRELLHQFDITEKHICLDDEHQFCAHGDVGAPLIFDNKMAGIHIWKGEYLNQRNPDVFLDLQRPDYNQWIRENTLLM